MHVSCCSAASKTAVFLDVDGVLNCHSTKDRIPGRPKMIGIDSSKVEILKEIVKAVNGEIILISTWKINWLDPADPDGRYLDRKLEEYGLKIIAATEDSQTDRGTGIRNYLDAHPEYRQILILDDENEGYQEQDLMKYLVRTVWFDRGNGAGLQPKHIRLAARIVKQQLQKKLI